MLGDWTLDVGGDRLTFGTRASGLPLVKPPVVDVAESRRQSRAALPSDDGVLFGVDHLDGTTITFEMRIKRSTADEAHVAGETLRRAWRGDRVRTVPGAVAELHAPTGRVTFGRPNRFAIDDRELHAHHRVPLVTFETVDDLFYGAEETVSVGLVPPPSGGLRAPLRAPLRTTQVGERSTGFRVGGSIPTRHWRAVVSGGDILSPVIEVPGCFRLELLGLSLAYDQVLVIDARPWVRTVLRDGGSVAGKRSRRSTPLRDAALTPGLHELVLRGQSTSGTARADLAWRPAFPTY